MSSDEKDELLAMSFIAMGVLAGIATTLYHAFQ